MGGDSSNRKYQAQYLDLVDENNGNAWVKASNPVTITWAYPKDTNENTEFTLYHFEGLHRDGTNSGFEISDVNGITPEKIDIDTDENGITFTVGSGGFSLFVLVWEEADDDDNPPYIPPTTGDDDDDEKNQTHQPSTRSTISSTLKAIQKIIAPVNTPTTKISGQ